MRPKRSPFWMFAFLAIPVLYFATQFLPFYHSGGMALPSLGSFFWFPEENEQSIAFVALFYPGFRVNELTTALLITQISALFLLIMTPILKSNCVVASLMGAWGLFGVISFLTTRSLTFSPVMVYGGIAGILMLVLFLAAITVSVLFLNMYYQNYRKKVKIFKMQQSMS